MNQESKCTFLTLRNKLIILAITFVLMAVTLNKHGTGNHWHLILGYVFYAFLALHLIWSWRWFAHLFRGHYPWRRILDIIVFLGMLIPLLVVIFTLSFSDATGALVASLFGMDAGHGKFLLHCIMGYQFFLFTSIHLGLHGRMIAGMAQQVPVLGRKGCAWITRLCTLVGIYFMVKVGFWQAIFHFASFSKLLPGRKELLLPTIVFFTMGVAIAYISHLILRFFMERKETK